MAENNTTGAVQFKPEELGKNAVKWRKDLLTIPVESFREQLGGLFQIRTGVRYQEKVGVLDGDMQFGPYDPDRVDNNDITISPRTLEVYLASVVKSFDPNMAIQSIWDEYVAKGAQAKNVPFVKYVAGYLMGKAGENLALHVWDGKRNPSGTGSADICDGIETILDKEIEAETISKANGNLVTIEAITSENAEDVFKGFYRAADRKLRKQKVYLVCSEDEYLAYCDAYQANHGALPYNKQFEQVTLEGSQGKCIIKPVPFVSDNYLKLVPAGNFVMGTNINAEETKLLIEDSKKNHFMVDFVATTFLGYQVQRIEKEFLLIGKAE